MAAAVHRRVIVLFLHPLWPGMIGMIILLVILRRRSPGRAQPAPGS
jgi:hypothetical protein